MVLDRYARVLMEMEVNDAFVKIGQRSYSTTSSEVPTDDQVGCVACCLCRDHGRSCSMRLSLYFPHVEKNDTSEMD